MRTFPVHPRVETPNAVHLSATAASGNIAWASGNVLFKTHLISVMRAPFIFRAGCSRPCVFSISNSEPFVQPSRQGDDHSDRGHAIPLMVRITQRTARLEDARR